MRSAFLRRAGLCLLLFGVGLLTLGGASVGQEKKDKKDKKDPGKTANTKFNREQPPSLKEAGIGTVFATNTVNGPVVTRKLLVKKSFSIPVGDNALHFNDTLVPITLTRQVSWVRLNVPVHYNKAEKVVVKESTTSAWQHLTKLKQLLQDATNAEGKEGPANLDILTRDLATAITNERTEAKTKQRTIAVDVAKDHWFVAWQLVEKVTVTYDWDQKQAGAVLGEVKKSSVPVKDITAAKGELDNLTISWPAEVFFLELKTHTDTLEEVIKAPKK